MLMLSASLIFGAISTFIPLYAAQIPAASTAVFLTIQAFVVVGARFGLRKLIPSDGKWPTQITAGATALLVSMGSALMGPIADWASYSSMYGICAALAMLMIAVALERRSLSSSSKSQVGSTGTPL